jgi:predicted flap endonuclease-1-like 5' DNA nuclease
MKKVRRDSIWAAGKSRGTRWLIWAVMLALVVWWWLVVNQESEDEIAPARLQTHPPAPVKPPVLPRQDDLKRIEGVGPKIQGLLQEAGIATFAKLADADVAYLETILRGARLYMANPATWPEQARLAASGQWEALAEMQAQLRGGRKV